MDGFLLQLSGLFCFLIYYSLHTALRRGGLTLQRIRTKSSNTREKRHTLSEFQLICIHCLTANASLLKSKKSSPRPKMPILRTLNNGPPRRFLPPAPSKDSCQPPSCSRFPPKLRARVRNPSTDPLMLAPRLPQFRSPTCAQR